MNCKFGKKLYRILAVALIAMLALPWSAFADDLVADGDGLTPVNSNALNLGNVNIGSTKSGTVLFAIQRQGNGQVFGNNTPVTVSAGTPSNTSVSTSVTESGI